MSARSFLASTAICLATATAFAQAPADKEAKKPSLVVGQPAPALSIEKWVKGAPVAKFEKGKVYIVEFWATWCGPCIGSMPHLSALQRQYKDKGLTVIGVTTEDPNNDLAAVEAMVKLKGAGMDYTVAWDKGKETNAAYMKAAQRRGIPCSFVVDGDGKVAYIGHPMYLDVPIAEIVAGRWDIAKGNAAIADAEANLGGIYKAIESDPKSASKKIAEFEKRYPAFASVVSSLKFDALMAAGDYDAAYAHGKKLVDDAIAHESAADLNEIAWKIVDPQADWKKRDLDLALLAAQKGVAFTKEQDANTLDTLARVHFLKGDVKKAIEYQEKAVAIAEGDSKASLEATLREYKAKSSQ